MGLQFFKKNILLRLQQNKKSILLLPLFFSSVVSAALSPEDQARLLEEQRWRQQREAEERDRQLSQPRVYLGNEGAPADLKQIKEIAKDEPCHRINQLILEVPPQLPAHIVRAAQDQLPQGTFRFLYDELEKARGQCFGKSKIGMLINQLLLELVKRGYTTTRIGLVPDQDLSSGTLKLVLLPGYIRTIKVSGTVRPPNFTTAFPTKAGKLLNLREIEQGLEQLQQVSSFDVSMQLVPGDRPGETDVVLEFARRSPWRAMLTFDDSGSTATGKLQAGANFTYDDPLGLNDVFSLGGTHDATHAPGDHESKFYNARYVVPFGNWTATWSASRNQSYQLIRASPTSQYITASDQSNMDLKLSYMFMRNQAQKNDLGFRVAKRWVESTTAGVVIPAQRRNMTYAELSWAHRHYFGTTKLDLTLSHTWGVPWLNAYDDMQPTALGVPRSSLSYNFQVLDATISTPFNVFGINAQYTVTFHGQTTQTLQESSNLISIGGRYSVRGFDENNSLIAEQGYYVRNEVQLPISKTNQAFFVGLDGGRVFGPSQSPLGSSLVGAAFGFRGGFWKGMSYEIFSSVPVYRPREFKSGAVFGFRVLPSID
jgi:hemolysin activation/secretion protein